MDLFLKPRNISRFHAALYALCIDLTPNLFVVGATTSTNAHHHCPCLEFFACYNEFLIHACRHSFEVLGLYLILSAIALQRFSLDVSSNKVSGSWFLLCNQDTSCPSCSFPSKISCHAAYRTTVFEAYNGCPCPYSMSNCCSVNFSYSHY